MSAKRGLVGLGLAGLLGLYAQWVIGAQLGPALLVVVWVLVIFLAARLTLHLLTTIGVSRARLQLERETALEARAKRLKAEREADLQITVAPPGHTVYAHELNERVNHRPLHLLPGQGPGDPLAEMQRWALYLLAHTASGKMEPALAGSAGVGQLSAGPPGAVELLPALDATECCLIVGPRNVGKTTLLQWIISRRATRSQVVVVDPHAYPGKWRDCRTIGLGRNYDEIGRGLRALLKLMDQRYDEIGQGLAAEGSHRRVTVVVDEWRAIVQNVSTAGATIKTLLTESRKAAFTMFVATHSERVKALGIEGEGDLKDGFTVVRLSKLGEARRATIDWGDGEVPATLPGPFPASEPADAPADLLALDAGEDEAEDEAAALRHYPRGTPSQGRQEPADAQFRALVEGGLSRRQAALKAYGCDYAGDIVSRGKRALSEL